VGYTTEFEGQFNITPPLTAEHAAVLRALYDDEGDNPDGAPPGYLQWVATLDGAGLKWDNGEKFYDYVEWLEYLIVAVLAPNGYKVNGAVAWSGEDVSDQGTIIVSDNVVTTRTRAEEAAAIADLGQAVRWVLACEETAHDGGMCDECRAMLKRLIA
jgi:hypothetical protein